MSERMTPERLAEITRLLDRRNYSMGLAARCAIEELLAELDAVTKEREKVTEQLEGAKRHTTRVESIARELAEAREKIRDALLQCDNWRNDHSRLSADREAIEAALAEHFGVRLEPSIPCYWFPTDPGGPVECEALADVIRQLSGILENEHSERLRAERKAAALTTEARDDA